MAVHVQRRGRYELFETTRGHRILVLDRERWFAWVQGQLGEILVRSDSDHERDHTIQEGEYYLIDFDNDRQFKDMPHLFLQEEDRFREVMLPNGLPSDDDVQKRVVGTDESIGVEELRRYLEDPESGEGEARMRRDDGPGAARGRREERELPIPNFDEIPVRAAKDHLDDLSDEELRRLRTYEAEHKQRKTMLEQIDRRLD